MAMTFEVINIRGEPAIRATGEIVPGDADRLTAVLGPNARHPLGYFNLVLDSPGGNVEAAFALAKLMDSHHFNTYVAPGATCVSACAAIVFMAGREHVAVKGARLGFHGCFSSKTKKIETLCNEQIAAHATAHGTSYGSVMAFIEEVPHDRIVWFDRRDADCWGINVYRLVPEPSNYYQCVIDAFKSLKKRR
jgi:hypothetical protein